MSDETLTTLTLETNELDHGSIVLEEQWEELQVRIFNEMGIWVPRLQQEHHDSLATGKGRLVLNGTPIGGEFNLGGEGVLDEIEAVIRNHAEDLVCLPLVDFWLIRLKASVPVLVRTATEEMGLARITTELKTMARDGRSIRDLAGILEELLEQTCSNA